MATIREVAQLAQVSTATVSRVLNQNGYVNKTTKERVEAIIKDLNYRPNDVARSLFKGSSRMIALFVPDITNPFFPEIARAVEDVTNRHGYTFVLCNTDNDAEKEIAYLNALQQKSVDGIVMVSSSQIDGNWDNMTTPIVALDRSLAANLSSVTVNNRDGARQAVHYLQSIGCKHIAHIRGPETVYNSMQRQQGYLDVVEKETWFTTDYIVHGGYSLEKAMQATEIMLTNHPEIDGIFAANDLMGIGVIKAIKKLNLSIPNDLAVIAFDGISLGEMVTPSLTTMAQPIYELGAKAAEMVMKQIGDRTVSPVTTEFCVQLMKRESTEERKG